MMRERKWLGADFAAAVACLMVAGLFGNAAMAQEVMSVAQNMPGFKAASVYQDFGNGESVAPFNGGLTVIHPSSISLPQNMGGVIRPVRCYNSKDINDGYSFTGQPSSFFNDKPYGFLGQGWLLSYGRVLLRLGERITKPDVINGTLLSYAYPVFCYYQDETGAERQLYWGGGVDIWQTQAYRPAGGWYFTNDGSYIRAYYNGTANKWTIFYPDGSKRTAGGTNAYVEAQPQAVMQNPDGSYCPTTAPLKNPVANGWYVTSLADRSGNSVSVGYRPYDPVSQPYAGSIMMVTDQFQREITFEVYPAGDAKAGLLMSITAGNKTEAYDYESLEWGVTPAGQPPEYRMFLTRVTDAGGLETSYAYQQYPATTGTTGEIGEASTLLAGIYYPTGAVSKYSFASYSYLVSSAPLNPEDAQIGIECRGMVAVSRTVNARPGVDSPSANVLKWTWARDWYPSGPRANAYYLYNYGIGYKVEPVITIDPFGTQTVAYFAVGENELSPVPPGSEVLNVKRSPGAALSSFDPAQPFAGAVSSKWQTWETGDRGYGGQPYGDGHRCAMPFNLLCSSPGVKEVENPNPRVAKTTESELDPATGQAKWAKTRESFGWDGFGHYELVVTSGTPDPGVQTAVFSAYQLVLEEGSESSRYQLGRQVFSRTGQGGIVWGVIENPHGGETPVALASGQFKAVASTYTPAGLLATQRLYEAALTGFRFFPDSLAYSLPASNASDKLLSISYDTNGNISHLQYSGCDSTAQYGFNFGWQYGMVSRMWRDNSPYGDEFNRAIDPATSLITNHTDTNGLVTSFEYDALNRLTKITPPGGGQPGGDYSTRVYYPNDATTYDGSTWATGHDILFYVGPEGFTPDVSDNVAGMDAGAAYAHYFFDDLGRLVKTRSLHADGQLYDAVTAYDPLGAAFFTSLPYGPADGVSATLALDWASKVGASGSTFVTNLPSKDGIHPYGGVTSVFANAAWTNNVQDLIAGDPERFYRPLWSFKPTGDVTGTTYDGLSSTVTLYNIKTGPGATGNSATTYTKDVFGRLMHVQPPLGSPADYTYDAFDHVIQANLSGQIRTWSYNALGRLVSATNPENGTTSYLKYDCIGNLLLAQDANGAAATTPYKLASTYDAAGRLLATDKVDALATQHLIANTYDMVDGSTQGASLGKLVLAVSYQNTGGTLNVPSYEWFQYDGNTGRVTYDGQATEAGGGYEENGLTFAYDQYGQVTQETLPGMGAVLGNVYSHGALVSRQMDGSPVLSALKYDAAGAMTEIDFETGETEKIALDQYERPMGFSFSDPGNVLRWANGSEVKPGDLSYAYQYDGAGNITSIGTWNEATGQAGPNDAFTYDLLSRLATATVNRAGYAHGYSYQYDAFGNLLGRTEALQNGAPNLKASIMNTAGYRVPGQAPDETAATNYVKEVAFTAQLAAGANGVTNNRLSSITRGGVVMGVDTGLAQESASMVYDPNGNLIDDGKYVYGYDALNRQVSVTDKSSGLLLSESSYLASGERIAKISYAGGRRERLRALRA